MDVYKQVTETVFWNYVTEHKATNQKGLPYNHLKVSGKSGFYNDKDELMGAVERVLAHESYYIKAN